MIQLKKINFQNTQIIKLDQKITNLKSHKYSTKYIIFLGNSSMFNHKDNNNLDNYYEDNFIIYKATNDIKKDEELFIN